MDTMLLRLLQRQVLLNCQFVLTADEELRRSPTDPIQTWYAIQNLLSAAANISKVLWGASGKLSAERQPVRTSLAVDESCPLRNVGMRNNFEHFDERLTRWWAESSNHNFVDQNFGDIRRAITGFDGTDIFRNFDPQTGMVTFWEEDVDLSSIVREVHRLLPIVTIEAEKPHWND